MKGNYRIKSLSRKPGRGLHQKINKDVAQLVGNDTFKKELYDLSIEYGFSYPVAMVIILGIGRATKKGCAATNIGQQKLADKINIPLRTLNRNIKQMEAAGIIDLWGRNRKETGWRTTSITILTCLIDYAERCAYWYRSTINQKNIAAEKIRTLNAKLALHKESNSIVDVKTGEIIVSIEDKPPKRSLAGSALAYNLSTMEYQP